MFIATGAHSKISLLGAKPGSGTFAGGSAKSDCAPTELRSKERNYKHLASRGEATNNVLLHFQFESAKNKSPWGFEQKPSERF